ncbi:MAG TPA: hypothetical protein VMZ30_17400 [Pyrinomonadaceae bacterium]|nr:hypothetical protein [Pyrinomonadaceae bacterium]
MNWIFNARISLKSIAVLSLNRISTLVAGNPGRYFIFDPRGWLEPDAETQRRLVYYLGGGESVSIFWKSKSGWTLWRVAGERVTEKRSCSAAQAIVAGLFSRVIIAKASRASLLLQRLFAFKFFVVDWKTPGYRDSAWRWLAVTANIDLSLIQNRWRDWASTSDDVVIMGTGPSATLVFEEPYRSMPVITCNTSLKSERLRKHRIAAFCIADALFFLAPTPYGMRFQEMLRSALAEQRFPIVINAEFYSFCRRRMPFIPEELLFPVVLNGHLRPNVDFANSPMAPHGSSVFPTLMFPLAIGSFKRIHLIGFDGKDPNMKNYYWKHSDEFQYQDELPTVKEHDPGSYGNREADYYDKYNATYSAEIDALISVARQRGCEINMVHPSFVPALKRIYEAQLALAGV